MITDTARRELGLMTTEEKIRLALELLADAAIVRQSATLRRLVREGRDYYVMGDRP